MSDETIPQMRETIDRLQKDLKSERSTIEQLTSDNWRLTSRDAFREEGFPAQYGDLYAGQNEPGEVTAESVSGFVDSFGLTKAEAPAVEGEGSTEEGAPSQEGSPGSPELAGMSGGGTNAGDGGSGGPSIEPMTTDAWRKLRATDPELAAQAVRQGRVQGVHSDGPVPPGTNPYLVEQSS